jgi:hypothetical protein
LEETVAGLEVSGRVRMKPRMLKVAEDHWLKVDSEEILFFEADEHGRTEWVTLRGRFHDLDAPTLDAALDKAGRAAVFIKISPTHAIAPGRIFGIKLQKKGNHILEVEGQTGIDELPLSPDRLAALEDCLEALNLGGGFLVSEPEDF